MGNTTKLRVFVKAIDNSHPNIEGATVYAYLYNSNSEHVQVTGVTQNHDGSYYFEISQPNFDFITYVANAFYGGMESLITTHFSVTANTVNEITVIINRYGSGYYFSLGKYNNFDTLFYYIGANIQVFPYKINVKSENNFIYYNNNNESVSSPSSLGTITGYCETQYLYVEIIPTSDLYDSATFRYDLFSYPGGLIGEYITRVPRKKYVIETPFVFDTIVPPVGNILGYNLPNTDIRIKFYGWPDYNYNDILSSSISAITIWNSGITTNYCNHDWFYRCLAGKKIKPVESVKILLEKNHYIDVSDKMLTVSARTAIADSGSHSIPYSDTSETACYLYVCQNDPNGQDGKINVFEDRVETFTLEREPDAVFTRQEIEDYVRGFGFTYNGCFGLPNNGGRSFGFDSFTLPPTTKTPPSKQYFYEDATHNLQGAIFSSNRDDFIDNFICALTCTNFYTEYTLTPELETHYTNDNNHCYVMEESIIPHSSPQPDYFYFYNHCGIPTGNVGSYSHEDLLTMDTNVGITLEKRGNPPSIQIQYSYNGHPWTDYEIGSELILLSGDRLYFKAKSQNLTFSLDDSNYYHFSVNNTYQSENPNSPTYEMLINNYCTGGTNGKFDTDKIVNKIKYDVIVGGRISSLLNPSNHGGWENSSSNANVFVNLFVETKITNCYDEYHKYGTQNECLKLDLLTIYERAYQAMFLNTLYLIKGPKILATTIGAHSMDHMFEYSSLTALTDNTLYFTLPASYCCYRMFAETNYNTELTITSSNGNGVSCFEEMFKKCNGKAARAKFSNMTIFGTDSCKQMFYSAKTEMFCVFSNPISDIGTTAFYEMYRKSYITAVNFTVTGSVQYRGCMNMCSNLYSECNITNMRLNAEDNTKECYSYMFCGSTKAKGTFTFPINSIAESACTYMFYNAGVGVNGITSHLLSPTNLSNACYGHMFEQAKLTNGVGPDLPATTLCEECYTFMFHKSNIAMQHSQEIPDISTRFIPKEFVLRATVLPKKCYYHMYSNSNFLYVSNVITRDLTTAGESSCGYMFQGTPITTKSRERKIKRDDGYYMSFCSNWRKNGGGHAMITQGIDSTEDTACYVGCTVVAIGEGYNTASGDLYMLSAMTANKGGTKYHFIDRHCEKLKAEITINNQTVGHFMTNTAYTYYSTWFSDKVCFARDGNAYVMTDGYGDDFPEESGASTSQSINGITYTGWHWEWISSKDNPKFSSDKRGLKKLGKYAVYETQEGTNGFELSCTYTVDIPGYEYDETHTFEYFAATEEVGLCATTLSNYCYENMFEWCMSLMYGQNFRFGNLTTLADGCFRYMFNNCQGLRMISPDLGNFTSIAPYSFYYMYANCSFNRKWYSMYTFWENDWSPWSWFTDPVEDDLFCGLNRIFHPSELRIKYDYNQGRHGRYTDIGTGYVVEYPKGGEKCAFFKEGKYPYWGEVGGLNLKHSYNDCDYYVFNYNNEWAYAHMFENCLSLMTCKIKLNCSTLYSGCYQQMFKGCGELVNNVYISENINNTQPYCCHAMFDGCYSYSGHINTQHKLTATGLTQSCYAAMFKGCGSMSAAPYLPATTMASGCYNEMFNSAVSNFYEIEIKIPVTAECLNHESSFWDLHWNLFFGVSGTNYNCKIFYYFQNEPLTRFVFVTGSDTTEEADYVNFAVNGVMSKNKTWYTPNTTFFYENFTDAIDAVQQKIVDLCNAHKLLYRDQDGREYHYRITDHGTPEVYWGNNNATRNEVYKGLLYLKCNISLADLSSPYTYTYKWVRKIGDDDITKNGHYWGRAYQANHGESAIPTRWEAHNA